MINTTENQTCIEDEHGTGITEVFRVLVNVTLIFGIFTNLILLATISCRINLRTTTHAFIASLAASDMIFACHGIRYSLVINHSQTTCDRLSREFIFFSKLTSASNYANIFLVSLERWLYISQPFLHQRWTSPKITAGGVALAWITAVILNIDIFVVGDDKYDRLIDIKLHVVYPGLHFIVSLSLAVIYAHVALIARRQLRAVNRTRPVGVFKNFMEIEQVEFLNTGAMKENLRSFRLLVLVFGSFFCLMTPGICYHLYDRYKVTDTHDADLHNVITLFTFSHCCVNFFVFTAHNKDFRCALMGYLRTVIFCINYSRCQRYVFCRPKHVPRDDTT